MSNSLFLVLQTLLLFTIVIINGCSDNAQCTFADRYLLVNYNRQVSFDEAEAYCVSIGSHLASLHNVDDWLEAKRHVQDLSNQQAWIGMNDRVTEGAYVYTDGSSANYFNWGNNEPSGDLEDCVTLFPSKEYKMNDFNCTGYNSINKIIVPAFLCNNPEYNIEEACHCDCDVCRIEGDPHITTFDKLLYHFMGPCSYYYVTPCVPNDYQSLPFEIVGEHSECFPSITGRTCLKKLWVNLYDENGNLVVQILMEEGLKATYTSKTTLSGLSGDVQRNTYIVWDNTPGAKKVFYLQVYRGNLDLQIYIWDTDDEQYEIMDARILLAGDFGNSDFQAYADIWISECWSSDYQVCGLCGYYDQNKLNDFTWYNPQTHEFESISTDGVSSLKDITADAWNRTQIFGEKYLDTELTENLTLCGVDVPLSPGCISEPAVEAICSAYFTKYCPCKSQSYYNLTWINSCIFDSCSLCADIKDMSLDEAVAKGCFQLSYGSCSNDCILFEPTKPPTSVPTIRPTLAPTKVPTQVPTPKPTGTPSKAPTGYPTPLPTPKPTRTPTQVPTSIPTPQPTTIERLSACSMPYEVDVSFVVDKSCPLTMNECEDEQLFISNIMESIKESNTNPLISYIEYSSTATVLFDFNNQYNNNPNSMFNFIRSRDCSNSGNTLTTNPYNAINSAINLFQTESSATSDKIIVLISNCYQDTNDVCSLSNTLNQLNIETIIINLGNQISSNAYSCITNHPIQSNINIDTDDLVTTLDNVVNDLCTAPTSAPTASPTSRPTPKPTQRPTIAPTKVPTNVPTPKPTIWTIAPTPKPTLWSTTTNAPTNKPTLWSTTTTPKPTLWSSTTTTTTTKSPTTAVISGGSDTAIAYDPQYGTCFDKVSDPYTPSNVINRWGWSNGPYTSTTFSRTLLMYAGAGQCDITKGYLVGYLYISRTKSGNTCTFTATYSANNGFGFKEIHFYVGTDKIYVESSKKSQQYSTAWGHYPYSYEFNKAVTSYTITINPYSCTDNLYVVAHSIAVGA